MTIDFVICQLDNKLQIQLRLLASILHISTRMSRWQNHPTSVQLRRKYCLVKYEQTEQEYSRAKMKVLCV